MKPRAVTLTYLAIVFQCEIEGKPTDPLRLGTCRYFQALDDARVTLVLQTRVFTLCVLTDDGKVDVVVTSREPGQRLAKYYRCIDVQLLAHGDVPGHVTGLGDWREEDTLKTGYERLQSGGEWSWAYP